VDSAVLKQLVYSTSHYGFKRLGVTIFQGRPSIISSVISWLLLSIMTLFFSVTNAFSQTVSDTSVCFDNPQDFNTPYVYFWNPSPDTVAIDQVNWPGTALEQRGEFYCHDFGESTDYIHLIFSNNGAQQTGDLQILGENRCRENGEWKPLLACGLSLDDSNDVPVDNDAVFTVYFKNTLNYAQPHIHYFDLAPATPNSNWPGPAMQPVGDVWYSYEFQIPVNNGGVVINDNGTAQTSDLVLESSKPCYQDGAFVSLNDCEYDPNSDLTYPDGKALFFVNQPGWANPTAYLWNSTPANSIPNSNWPGELLTEFGAGNVFHVEIGDNTEQGNVIFSNAGTDQTADLNFLYPNLCYNDGVWLTLAECGIPVREQLNVGGDRKVNRGAQVALTLPKNTVSGNVIWQSDAWTGDLEGDSVVTPAMRNTGTYIVTVSVGDISGQFNLEVVSAVDALPERPTLAKSLNFPINGSVSTGDYEFEVAFPNIADHFIAPVQVLNDGVNNLIYVVDKPGLIWMFPNDTNVDDSQLVQILDIRDEVRDNHEQGFISMAFHPNFAQNGFAYIYYIEGENDDPSSGGRFDDGVLQRITLDSTINPKTVVTGSRVDVLRVPQVGNDHKGGKMEFHPNDGLFFMSFGDGAYAATAGDPVDPTDPRKNNAAQETDNLLGTFIRIEMLDTPIDGRYYRVPSDNPFVANAAVRDEIWSYGHRNPWRWSFQQTAPYTLWETEVGQAGFEEVNIIEPGNNYGWPICEGETHRGQAGGDPQLSRRCTGDLVGPVDGYFHSTGSVSIIGGVVYNGNALPALRGKFLFGDYISKNIWTIEQGQSKELLSDGFPSNIVSFGTDLSGDQILVSAYGLEFGVSGIYRIIDRDAAAAVVPSKLSETGIFADLSVQFPVSGVIEYQVNAQPWFDGAQVRFFVSTPNEETITFSQQELWTLPVGSVVVKHSDVQVSATQTMPFETSVLFHQQSGWEAANYRWNSQGFDADLVTTTRIESISEYIDGSLQTIDRTVRAGGECSSCHTGLGGKDPRGLKTRQLNRAFSHQGVSENQLDLFDRIGLFNEAISAASNYASYVDPADQNADLDERARAYLDVNCSSCHAGSLMNLKYGVALADMDIMNRRLAGSQYRLLPFDHTRSVLHSFQVSDGNRMPRGTSTTNPLADDLFKQWIDANDAVSVERSIEISIDPQELRVGNAFGLQLVTRYNNGFEEREYSASRSVFWTSSNTNVVDVSAQSGGSITVTPQAVGQTTITAMVDGVSAVLVINVVGSVMSPIGFTATALSSSSISLSWISSGQDPVQGGNYRLQRSNNASGPFTDLVSLPSSEESFVDSGLSSSTRYYYQIRAITTQGSSSAVSAFADTSAATSVDALQIETGSNFQLLASESRQLIALSERNGELDGVTSSANWLSSNSNVISVSATGLVTGGPQAGSATISASFGGASANIELTNRGPGTYLYFNNRDTNWAEVRAYVFATSNGIESAETGQWPGVIMEPAIELGGKWSRLALSRTQFGQQQTEVVFNCGSANCKTDDVAINTAITAQWFNGSQWLAGEPPGDGAVSIGTQLVINNGEVTWANNGSDLSGRLLTPGAVVDLRANQVGIGQTFKRWEGSAAPYIVNPTSSNAKMLVPSALSLTINGVFEAIVDSYGLGRDYYRSAQAGCVACHGIDGQGSPPLSNLGNKYTLSELSAYITSNMPLGNVGACVGDCADEIAKMLLAESFEPPTGVCNFDDLNDMVPADRSNRLLTLYEYNNSVRDILGLPNDVDVTTGNLPATIPINGFKTAANTLFTDDYAQGYVNAASEVADLISNDLSTLAPTCNGDLSCAIEAVGKRVYRRPLSENELAELIGVHASGGDRGVIISLFSSPIMLYRSEVGHLITAGPQQGYYQLSDYEVASMLSYTFWGTTPDDWLMNLADSQSLTTSEQLYSAVQQMLDDPRSERALERFVEGWMELEKEIGTRSLSQNLKDDMKEETMRFVKSILFSNGSYNDLLTANYSLMTQRLADHYGLPWPGGSGWQQVFYSGENAERRGILGHASVLTIQSAQEKTHPVKRGLFVRKNLMCQEFPPPPLGAALDPESDPSKGVRHRFETAHAQPGCDTCHQYIDGIGFGLESYNSFGQFVRTELTENGTELPIDASGYIGSLDSAETFLSSSSPVINYQGLDQLTSLIADSDHGKSCFARQWFRYANGRRESSEDSCTLQSFSNDFKVRDDVSLKDLIIEFTQTSNYTLRK